MKTKTPLTPPHTLIRKIGWIPTAVEVPDDDCTVLIACDDTHSDPVWMGYHNGDEWLTIEGAAVLPTHWSHLPAHPSQT